MLVPAFESNGVHRTPDPPRFIQHIHHVQSQQLVRHREIHPKKPHRLCPLKRRAQEIRLNLESDITPVQSQSSDARVLHRGRGRMFDWTAEDRAITRTGIEWFWKRP